MKFVLLFSILMTASLSHASELTDRCMYDLKQNYGGGVSNYLINACQAVININQLACIEIVAEAGDLTEYKAYACINGMNDFAIKAVVAAYAKSNTNSNEVFYYLANVKNKDQRDCIISVTKFYRLNQQTAYNCLIQN